MVESKIDFESLISPCTVGEFFDDHWESKPLLLHRETPGFYDGLMGLEDFDACLHAARDTLRPILTIVPPPDSGREKRPVRGVDLAPKEIYNSFTRGDTLAVGSAERLWRPLATLTSHLSERLNAVTNVNLYLTPAGSQGFELHFDPHDVFILQTHGSKDWFLYEPWYELPTEAREARNYLRKLPTPPAPENPEPTQQIRLRQGDFLYLPRGVPHQAVATDETSLHLTVGIHTLYWVDLVKAAVELTMLDDRELRRALPPGKWFDGEPGPEMAETFRELTHRAFEGARGLLGEALGTLADYHLNLQSYPPDGHLEQLSRSEELGEASLVRRRSGVGSRLGELNGAASIRFPDNEVQGPPMISEALRFIHSHKRFRVAELPGLDAQSRVVLTRRLVKEGLLQVVAGEGGEG